MLLSGTRRLTNGRKRGRNGWRRPAPIATSSRKPNVCAFNRDLANLGFHRRARDDGGATAPTPIQQPGPLPNSGNRGAILRSESSRLSQAKRAIAMTTNERIMLDPAILAGKPVVRGTRLAVEFVIGLMADGWSEADILANYPGLTREDIVACLAYAR